jgi:hypothetical protein
MGSGVSGLYVGTAGARSAAPVSAAVMSSKLVAWAQRKSSGMSNCQRRKFNTACVVYDEESGRYFYGRNRGIELGGNPKNPQLFGGKGIEGILPSATLKDGLTVGQCAEVDAVNKALNAGAKLGNLTMMTIFADEGRGGRFGRPKCACPNCTYAFKGRIKYNHSGWEEA